MSNNWRPAPAPVRRSADWKSARSPLHTIAMLWSRSKGVCLDRAVSIVVSLRVALTWSRKLTKFVLHAKRGHGCHCLRGRVRSDGAGNSRRPIFDERFRQLLLYVGEPDWSRVD